MFIMIWVQWQYDLVSNILSIVRKSKNNLKIFLTCQGNHFELFHVEKHWKYQT